MTQPIVYLNNVDENDLRASSRDRLKDTIKPWDLGEIKEASFVPTLPCERVINTIVEKNDFPSFDISG